MLNNEMTELLQIEYPIIQAPMAGGVTTSKLVADGFKFWRSRNDWSRLYEPYSNT